MKANLNMSGIFSSQIEVCAKTQTVSNNEFIIKEFKDTYAVVDPINVSGIDFNNLISLSCKPLEIVWPMFGCDAKHTCRSIFNTSGIRGNKEWSLFIGGVLKDIIVVDASGRVIFISSDTVYCVSLDGSVVWKYVLPDLGGIGVTIGSGAIYAPSKNGYLYALNPDGTLKWSLNIGAAIYYPPIIYSDKNTGEEYLLFVDYNGVLHCLNSNGVEVWSKTVPTGKYIHMPAIDDNGNIYIYKYESSIYYIEAIDISGNTLWVFDISSEVSAIIRGVNNSPTVGSDGIYFAASFGFLYGVNSVLMKIDFSGNVLWGVTVSGWIIKPVAEDSNGDIYIVSNESVIFPLGAISKLYKLSKSGKILWSYTFEVSYTLNNAIGKEGTIYIGNDNGYLFALNPNGTLLWKFEIGESVEGIAIAPNKKIYVTTSAAKLYCVG